jgi:hypothetical protein
LGVDAAIGCRGIDATSRGGVACESGAEAPTFGANKRVVASIDTPTRGGAADE